MIKKIFLVILYLFAFKLATFIVFLLIDKGIFHIEIEDIDKGNFIIKLFGLSIVLLFLKYQKQKFILPKTSFINFKHTFIILICFVGFAYLEGVFTFFNRSSEEHNEITLYRILNTVILAPILEEIIYRGFIINYLLPDKNVKYKKIVFCVFFVSIVFALIHGNFEWYHFVYHFLFSVVISILFFYQRSVFMVILFHSFFNLSILFFNVNFISLKEILQFEKEWYFILSIIFLLLTGFSLVNMIKYYKYK